MGHAPADEPRAASEFAGSGVASVRDMRSFVVALGAAIALTVSPAVAHAASARPQGSSTASAYDFLDLMMDKYASGHVLRLVQSFQPQPALDYTASVTYDDALVIDAYLARGRPGDVRRATVIGDALLFVQTNDVEQDGRLRAAYAPTPLRSPARIKVVNATTTVGSLAWAGMALTRLRARTGNDAYLDGALAIGNWIQDHAADTRGAGGYTGGARADGTSIQWKSTEHNIDAYALFEMLASATGDPIWSTRANAALTFVQSMWEPTHGRFFTGTEDDGVTVNDTLRPEDVNSWSYLALQAPEYEHALDWDRVHLAAKADGFDGVSFCQGDRSGVWFEGTAHLALAFALRGSTADAAHAQRYLATIRRAQVSGLNADGRGIIAASKDGLGDCGGDGYDASLHTGATAWYLLAARGVNPFIAAL